MAMQLASMVHGSMRDRDVLQHSQHAGYYQTNQPRGYPVSTAAPSYSNQQQQQPQHTDYRYQQQQQVKQQHQRPQSPPSPPAEEQKPSLPSISHLLEFAGGDKAASETAAPSPQSQHRHSTSPQPRHPPHRAPGPMQPAPPLSSATVTNPPRMTLPPTPPMHSDVTHDGNQSPSAASNHSAASSAYYMANSLNNIEPHQQRQPLSTMAPVKRDVAPTHTMSPYSTPVYGQAPYSTSPATAPATSYYSPEQHSYNGPGMYTQRPLPTTYQPTMPLPVPTPTPNGANPWQHHHYISTSSQAQFPQSQDRYICSTCNKAFSRPSSLRIHSHSHTGEKPYRCAQPGCGKAFSVRSNMKRHERGCHAANNAALTT